MSLKKLGICEEAHRKVQIDSSEASTTIHEIVTELYKLFVEGANA